MTDRLGPGDMSPPTADQDKHTLRSRIRRQRAATVATLVPQPGRSGLHQEQINSGHQLADLLLSLINPHNQPVAAFISVAAEPQMRIFLDSCRLAGTPVLLPILRPDSDLDWSWDNGDYQPGCHRRILEPAGPRLGRSAISQAGLVLVPALAVDSCGHRLGQGGGSYDRALPRVRPDARVLAVVHPTEILPKIPHQEHDCLVHGAVTTAGITWFKKETDRAS